MLIIYTMGITLRKDRTGPGGTTYSPQSLMLLSKLELRQEKPEPSPSRMSVIF